MNASTSGYIYILKHSYFTDTSYDAVNRYANAEKFRTNSIQHYNKLTVIQLDIASLDDVIAIVKC